MNSDEIIALDDHVDIQSFVEELSESTGLNIFDEVSNAELATLEVMLKQTVQMWQRDVLR